MLGIKSTVQKMHGAFFMPKIKQLAIKASNKQVKKPSVFNGLKALLQMIASKNQVKKQLPRKSRWLLLYIPSTATSRKEIIMEMLKKRLANLLCVKSLVTLVLTAVFAFLAVEGKISQEFMTVYTVVIAFYFGTQATKESKAE